MNAIELINQHNLSRYIPTDVRGFKRRKGMMYTNMSELTYKNYTGMVCRDAGTYCGKIKNISDLVMYQSDTYEGLQSSFEEAVEDYIETRKEINEAKQS